MLIQSGTHTATDTAEDKTSTQVKGGRILLAPMEGVVDASMRDLLTRVGSLDRCVTEFVRVTTTLLPKRVFQRFCPELSNNSCTPNGTPVYLQLLGGNPEMMAKNAARAAALGCAGIDLNFGCPAKTVNRHDGGSILLNEPERVQRIVAAVRASVSSEIPVTAKIRLGVENNRQLESICRGVENAGASELCIHARTKSQGYKPPAHWHECREASQKLSIPVTINGEIWNYADAQTARNESFCSDIMLGRGAIARPDLARQIRSADLGYSCDPMTWPEVVDLLQQSFSATEHTSAKHIGNRLRQWLVYLRRSYPQAATLFDQVKTLRNTREIDAVLDSNLLNDDRIPARTAS